MRFLFVNELEDSFSDLCFELIAAPVAIAAIAVTPENGGLMVELRCRNLELSMSAWGQNR
jgi:hypothetical protein